MGIIRYRATIAGMVILAVILLNKLWYSSPNDVIKYLEVAEKALAKDICKELPSRCDENANCTATVGDFFCTCKDGYSGNGYVCEDLDECRNSSRCISETTCRNTDGGFSCKCNAGYTGNNSGCRDLDECTNPSTCHSDADCTNNDGSFTCKCKTGYSGNGFDCKDVDECEGSDTCDINAECENNIGSFSCTCNVGFQGNGLTCSELSDIEVKVSTNTMTRDQAIVYCNTTVGGWLATIEGGKQAKIAFDGTDRNQHYHVNHNLDQYGNVVNSYEIKALGDFGVSHPIRSSILPITDVTKCVVFYRSQYTGSFAKIYCGSRRLALCFKQK